MKPALENLPAVWLLSLVITNTEYQSCYLTEYRDHDSNKAFPILKRMKKHNTLWAPIMLLSLICEKLWTDQVIFQLYPVRTNSFQIPSEGCPNLVPRRLSNSSTDAFLAAHVNAR